MIDLNRTNVNDKTTMLLRSVHSFPQKVLNVLLLASLVFGAYQLGMLALLQKASITAPRTARSQVVSSMTVGSTGAIRKIGQEVLHVSKPTWWLESRFHFSFADWWNPARNNFHSLRVVNDDLVKGGAGFGTHPHRDAEIFSYIIDGALSHQDSMGNKEALPRGCVQYLSAGTGITHSEMNDGQETCRFLQVWLMPDRRGHTPQYGSSTYSKDDRHNKLLQVLFGTAASPAWPGISSKGSPIHLNQDANVFVSENDAGVSHTLSLAAGRAAYLVCIEGNLTVNGVELSTRDAAEVEAVAGQALPLTVQSGKQGSHFLLIEMAQQ